VGSIEAYLRNEVSTSIVERWRRRVLQDVDQRPFTDDERARAGDLLDGAPLISYGCTLVLALFAPQWIGFLQIGDGDVTVVQGNSAYAPVPGDDRLVGGETTSLCLPTAAADARVAAVGEPLPDLVALTSDGYANSFASPTWRTDVGLDLRRQLGRLGIEVVEAELVAWLADSAVAAGDDVSMALVQRKDVPGADASAATSSFAATSGVAPTPQPSTRRWATVASVGVAAIIGIGVGWLLADRDGDETTSDAIALPAASSAVPTSPPMTATSAPESSPSRSTSTTVGTPTSTTPPTTTPSGVEPSLQAPTRSVLGSQDQVLLLVGEENSSVVGSDADRLGVVLAFDPESPATPNAQSFGWVVLDDPAEVLPSPWSFGFSGLFFGERLVGGTTAVVVAPSGDYVWAVELDGRRLTAYAASSGEPLATTPISDAGAPFSTVQAAFSAPDGSVSGTTATTSSIPSETTES
jgi:hypothetical protein